MWQWVEFVGEMGRRSKLQRFHELVNHSAALYIFVPSQRAIRGGRFLCGRMRGSTPAGVESPELLIKFSNLTNAC